MGLLANNYERKEFIKLELEDVKFGNPPIHFDTFQPGKFFFLIFYYNLISSLHLHIFQMFTGYFILYLMACQTKNGTRLSKAGYYSKQAGLYHLYWLYGRVQTQEFQEQFKVIFKAFLITVAEEVQNGNGRISTGKVPLSFKLFCKLCIWMFQDNSPSGRFAHLFLVLLWNLACRSSNTQTIYLHHLSWIHDSLQIYFAQMKNDQTGDRP